MSSEAPDPSTTTDSTKDIGTEGTRSEDFGLAPTVEPSPEAEHIQHGSSTDETKIAKDENNEGHADGAATGEQSLAESSTPTQLERLFIDAPTFTSQQDASEQSKDSSGAANADAHREQEQGEAGLDRLADQAETVQEWDEKQDSAQQRSKTISPLPDNDFDDKQNDLEATESRPEIENIVQQFRDGHGQELDEATSPKRSELPVFQYPPRSSSLEDASDVNTSAGASDSVQSETGSISSPRSHDAMSISSQRAPAPPDPDPEPALPFDFHRFLEQLRHRTADPVAKFLRSFLIEFGKKQWQVHEQTKIIADFLTFISGKMSQCDVWRNVSDAEFDNAREGMEKLVMNRLYNQTFSPEIPPVEASPIKGRRKGTPGPGRKGQHQEDVERDEVLAQKVQIYGWIREEHLDMQPFGEKGRKFLRLAQQELRKIKSYRAPRDKIICVLNTCKVLFGFLRSAHNKDQSADAFIPLLIWTVLKANPDHLVSNVQYILRFRSQEKLTGEAGYYMSSLMGAVQFIENLDRTNLTISDEEFEANVEAAVSSFQEPHKQNAPEEKPMPPPPQPPRPAQSTFNEKAALVRPEVTPRHSMEGERASSRRTASRNTDASGGDEENAAVAGLLRTIQKPLSTIGRIFSDDGSSSAVNSRPPSTPQPEVVPRPSRNSAKQPPPPRPVPQPVRTSPGLPPLPGMGNIAPGALAATNRTRISEDEAAARQASAESARAQEVSRTEHRTVVETLAGMFPGLDKDIISDVVRQKEGHVGLAVDACLSLSR